MEKIEFSQKELQILVNLIYGMGQSLNIADTRLVLPILDKLESRIVKPVLPTNEPVKEEKVFKETN